MRDLHVAVQRSPIQRQESGARPQSTGIYTCLSKQLQDPRIACFAVRNCSVPKSLWATSDLTARVEKKSDRVHIVPADCEIQSRQTRRANNFRGIGACVKKELHYTGVPRNCRDVQSGVRGIVDQRDIRALVEKFLNHLLAAEKACEMENGSLSAVYLVGYYLLAPDR